MLTAAAAHSRDIDAAGSPPVAARPAVARARIDAEDRSAVVIGSGFGGLASAIRLAARGFRVTLLERLDRPGGRARVFRQDGFVFDAGPTIVTAPFLLDELWALAGRRLADDVTLVSLDPFYRIRFDDGTWFTCSADPAAMRAEVARIAPEDVAGYERYMAVSADMYRSGFDGFADIPFSRLTDMARILPDLVRLRADRSVFGLASKYVRHPKLRIALSFHPLFVGGNPLEATAFYSMVSHLERAFGVGFVMGGTGALVDAMARLIERMGGTVRLGAEVAAIEADGGRVTGVRLASGERLTADVVVSNADSAWTYGVLAPEAGRRTWSRAKLTRARYSMGLFVWYFGTRRRYDAVDHHSIVLGPRYEPLLRDIFRRKRLADDFSLYVHRPTATDPSLAPQGCDAFYALSPVPNLRGETDWAAMAEPYRARIQARLEETILPGLGREIVSSRVLTPKQFREDYLSVEGAAFGLEPVLTQMAWFRPHNESEDLTGLYLVGAGTHPGAGLPGVLCSAAVVDKLIDRALAEGRLPKVAA